MSNTENIRFVAVGRDVHDKQTGRVARCSLESTAVLAADRLNAGKTAIEDLEWKETA